MNAILSRSDRGRTVSDKVPPGRADISGVLVSVLDDSPYRHNAFRLAGLRVDATSRQLRTRLTELEASQNLAAPLRGDSVLPVSPPPDLVDVKAALNRLRDPVQRLVQEVFWFWPVDGDVAWSYFVGDDPDRGARLWLHRLDKLGPSAAIAAHNLAILNHVKGIENSNLDTAERCSAAHDALVFWDDAFSEEAFWAHLEVRAAAIDDRRLSREIVADLRRVLPEMLLRMHSVFISRGGRDSIVHLTVLNEFAEEVSLCPGAFTVEAIDRARHSAARELSGQLKTIADEEGETAARQPRQGDSAATRMLERTREPLQILDRVCRTGDPIRDGAHDDLVRAVIFCITKYCNETHDLMATEALLKRLESIATTEASRQRIAEDRAGVADLWLDQVWKDAGIVLETSKSNGARAAQQILDGAQPALVVLGAVLGADNEYLLSLHDEVVISATKCTVAYLGHSGDLATAAELLAQIAPFAVTPRARALVQENTAELTEIQQRAEDAAWLARPPTYRATEKREPEVARWVYLACVIVGFASLMGAWAGYTVLYVPLGIAVAVGAVLYRVVDR